MAGKTNHRKKNPDDLTVPGAKRIATIELTKLIKQMGSLQHTVADDGTPLTKMDCLAQLIWNKALGYTEKDVKTGEELVYHPDRAFIAMIWDRTEGKVMPASKDLGKEKAKVSDRVSEQTTKRLNQLAEGD